MKKTDLIFPIIMGVICCLVIFNPQHDRELSATILIGGFFAFNFFKNRLKVPTSWAFYSILACFVVVSLSYISTVGSSMNYRPYFVQCLGFMVFVTVYTNKIKYLRRSLICCSTIISIAYAIAYFFPFINTNMFFGNPNIGSMFFAMVIPLCYRKKWIYCCIPIVFALLLIGSRGAFGALSIITIIAVIKLKKWKALILVGLIIAIAITPIHPLGKKMWVKGFSTFYELNGKKGFKIFSVRDLLFKEGIVLVKQSPLVGVGVGNAHFNNDHHNYSAHNMYLKLHSFGGVLTLFFFFVPLFYIKRNRLSIYCYLIFGFISDCGANSLPNIVIYWALLAYSIDKEKVEVFFKNKHSIYIDAYNIKRFLNMCVILIYMFCCFWAWKHYQVNLCIINSINNTKKYTLLDRAIELEPKNFKAYYFRGLNKFHNKDYAGAMKDLAIVEHLVPNFGATRKILGRFR